MESFRNIGDGVSIVAAVATLAGWLPTAAALASLVWTLIRIYETKTVQNWMHGRTKGRKR